MRNRSAAVILLLLGALSLFRIWSNPRVETLHGSDIVQIMGSGMCFGAAVMALVGRKLIGSR